MTEQSRHILWTDEDAPERFRYGEYRLKSNGWTVAWATSVTGALETLSASPFDVLILDQMMPLDDDAEPAQPFTVWGGCIVLRWLRRASIPDQMPDAQRPRCEELWQLAPLPRNETIPVVLVTGYQDDAVLQAIRSTSERDRTIKFLPKPLDYGELEEFLDKI